MSEAVSSSYRVINHEYYVIVIPLYDWVNAVQYYMIKAWHFLQTEQPMMSTEPLN